MSMQPVILLLIFVCAFVLMPAIALRYRRLELRHKERMTAFDKGIALPPEPPDMRDTHDNYQLRGLIWLAGGVGLSITLFVLMPVLASNHRVDTLNRYRELKEMGFTDQDVRESIKIEQAQVAMDAGRFRALAALGIPPAAIGLAYLAFWASKQPKLQLVKME